MSNKIVFYLSTFIECFCSMLNVSFFFFYIFLSPFSSIYRLVLWLKTNAHSRPLKRRGKLFDCGVQCFDCISYLSIIRIRLYPFDVVLVMILLNQTNNHPHV